MRERIVLVEDDRELRDFLVEVLAAADYEVSAHASAVRALMELSGGADAALVVTDLVMPGMSGQELLAEVRIHRSEINVIVITVFGTIDSAIELVKAGAYDYLTRPFGSDELLLAVETEYPRKASIYTAPFRPYYGSSYGLTSFPRFRSIALRASTRSGIRR